MIRVCAMITVFACVGTLLNELAGLSGLPAALLSGFLEFSGGIALCAELPGVAGPVLAAALLGWAGIERADAGARGRGRAALNADVPLRPRFAGGGDGIGSVFPLPLNRLDKRRIFCYTVTSME